MIQEVAVGNVSRRKVPLGLLPRAPKDAPDLRRPVAARPLFTPCPSMLRRFQRLLGFFRTTETHPTAAHAAVEQADAPAASF